MHRRHLSQYLVQFKCSINVIYYIITISDKVHKENLQKDVAKIISGFTFLKNS